MDVYIKDGDGNRIYLGVMVGNMDEAAEEQMNGLLARAFTEGRAYQGNRINHILNERIFTPWR